MNGWLLDGWMVIGWMDGYWIDGLFDPRHHVVLAEISWQHL